MNIKQRKAVLNMAKEFIDKYNVIDELEERDYENMYEDAHKVVDYTNSNMEVCALFNCLYALFDDKEQEKK